jgi:hypothetical protein
VDLLGNADNIAMIVSSLSTVEITTTLNLNAITLRIFRHLVLVLEIHLIIIGILGAGRYEVTAYGRAVRRVLHAPTLQAPRWLVKPITAESLTSAHPTCGKDVCRDTEALQLHPAISMSASAPALSSSRVRRFHELVHHRVSDSSERASCEDCP